MNPSIQKLLKILAPLLDSLSNDVGQNASAPNLLAALLTGRPAFSNHILLFSFVFCQVEALDEVVELISGPATAINTNVETKETIRENFVGAYTYVAVICYR